VDDGRSLHKMSKVNRQLRQLINTAEPLWMQACLRRYPQHFRRTDRMTYNLRKALEYRSWMSDPQTLPPSEELISQWKRMGTLHRPCYTNTFQSWRATFFQALTFDKTRSGKMHTPGIMKLAKRTLDGTLHEGRSLCDRCHRPPSGCYCHALPAEPLNNSGYIDLVVLMHPKCPTNVGTVQILSRMFDSVTVLCDIDFSTPARNVWLDDLLENPNGDSLVLLLYVGDKSVDVSELNVKTRMQEQGKRRVTLLLIDGSWGHARYIYRWNPRLQALPCIHITPTHMSVYDELKKEPSETCVCTAEAAAYAIAGLDAQLEHRLPANLVEVS
jgi:DTW domain-containing protein YfiP